VDRVHSLLLLFALFLLFNQFIVAIFGDLLSVSTKIQVLFSASCKQFVLNRVYIWNDQNG